MKKTIPALILGGLMIAALTSCQKDDDTKPSTGTTTTSTTSGTTNPLIKKACRGVADVLIEGTSDTLPVMEMLMSPGNLYSLIGGAEDFDISLVSGLKNLPQKTSTFTVAGDPDKVPASTEMIVSYYDGIEEKDYYAVDGTITYTIATATKQVKFTNLTFKAFDGATKTISYEVNLN